MTRVNFRYVTLCINSYLKILPLTRFAILGLLLNNSSASLAQSDDLDTNMAKDPRGLVESVTVPAFLPPNEYNRKFLKLQKSAFSQSASPRSISLETIPMTQDPESQLWK